MRLGLQTVALLVIMLLQPLQAAPSYDYEILERAEHDPQIFTQGLVSDTDYLYESSGHYGRSFVLRYPKASDEDEAAKRLDMPRNIFAEGLTLVGDHLYLVSWKEGKAWAIDRNDFQVLQEFRYRGEGWGLTFDGKRLIMSDGSDLLRFYQPDDFKLSGTLKVQQDGKPVKRLNELEYHEGLIWANQWYSNLLYAIDADNGEVKATVDLSELQKASAVNSSESVLNGIAYDAEADAFWITGKYWRHRYLLRFTAK